MRLRRAAFVRVFRRHIQRNLAQRRGDVLDALRRLGRPERDVVLRFGVRRNRARRRLLFLRVLPRATPRRRRSARTPPRRPPRGPARPPRRPPRRARTTPGSRGATPRLARVWCRGWWAPAPGPPPTARGRSSRRTPRRARLRGSPRKSSNASRSRRRASSPLRAASSSRRTRTSRPTRTRARTRPPRRRTVSAVPAWSAPPRRRPVRSPRARQPRAAVLVLPHPLRLLQHRAGPAAVAVAVVEGALVVAILRSVGRGRFRRLRGLARPRVGVATASASSAVARPSASRFAARFAAAALLRRREYVMTLASAGLRGGARGTAPVAKGSTAFASTAASASRDAMAPVVERPERVEGRDARGEVARASCAGAGCVRAATTRSARGHYGTGRATRRTTRNARNFREAISFPSAGSSEGSIGKPRSSSIAVFRRPKGHSGASPNRDFFEKLGGKTPKFIRLVLPRQYIFGP